MSTQPLSHKVAAFRAYAASLPTTPPKAAPRIHNTPTRAARGHGVPPSKVDDAPAWSISPGGGLRIIEVTDATTHRRSCEIVADVSGSGNVWEPEAITFVEADRMVDLLPWLTKYFAEADRLAAENDAAEEVQR